MWVLLMDGQQQRIGQIGFVVFAQRTGTEQVLDESWVKYSAKPTNTSERMGAQFWLNAGGSSLMFQRDVLLQRFSRTDGGYYSITIW
jgi:hypothetical protein